LQLQFNSQGFLQMKFKKCVDTTYNTQKKSDRAKKFVKLKNNFKILNFCFLKLSKNSLLINLEPRVGLSQVASEVLIMQCSLSHKNHSVKKVIHSCHHAQILTDCLGQYSLGGKLELSGFREFLGREQRQVTTATSDYDCYFREYLQCGTPGIPYMNSYEVSC